MSEPLTKPKSLETIFPQEVSVFPNAFAETPSDRVPLGAVLDAIREGEWEKQVSILRKRLERGDQKGYDAAKRSLPAFTMSASLLTRDKKVPENERVQAHTGILQADFDSKENPHLGDLDSRKWELIADPHVAFVFTSPSGKGLKVGVVIDPDHHLACFLAAEKHFLSKYGLQLDKSTKDPVRLCFVSHDPDLLYQLSAVAIQPLADTEVKTVVQQRLERGDYAPVPIDTTADDVREMLRYISPRPDYDTWLRIASAVWSVLPMAEGCRVLSEWSPEEHLGEYADKYRSRLEQIKIGTLAWYAQQGGFDARAAARKKIWAGRIRFAPSAMRTDIPDSFEDDPADDIQPIDLQREFVVGCFQKKQLGDAELFARLAQGRKLYDHLGQCWRTYRAGIWARDDMQQTLLDVPQLICEVYDELASSVRDDVIQRPPTKKKDSRTELLEAIAARIARLRTTGYLSGVMTFAESMLCSKATMFDQNPGLLCVENGTINFESGQFREHQHKDMLTHKTLCRLEPGSECPRWMSFLDFFMGGDQEMIDYLARAVGYSLTGYVDYDVMFFLYGKGANGKSTFTSTLQMLLGDHMTTIAIEALMAKASDPTFDYRKAQMEGKRVVVSDEIPESRRLNESAIKSLVGGDAITARRPYEKPYTFTPTHKLWLVGNHKPRIDGTDYGIWRRVHLIPWLVTMPEEDRRPRFEVLSEFREELPGILNWAIAGWIDLQERGGLHPPAQVVAATKEYQSDSDQFAQFLEARTEASRVDSVSLTDLREAYQAWCEDEGETPRYQSNKKVSCYMRDQGWHLQKVGEKKQVHVLGIKINPYS